MFPIIAVGALVAAGAAALAASSSQPSGPPQREASRPPPPATTSYLVTPVPSGSAPQAELAAVEAVRRITV